MGHVNLAIWDVNQGEVIGLMISIMSFWHNGVFVNAQPEGDMKIPRHTT